MTGKELENIGNKLSEKTGLIIVFWYTAEYIEGRREDELEEKDKTYHVVVKKDESKYYDSGLYFKYRSNNWEELYEITTQLLKLLKYEVN